MNLYAEFHELIAAILSRIAAQGRLPADLDLQRFAVEPPPSLKMRRLRDIEEVCSDCAIASKSCELILPPAGE